jgi:hypothetical protein
VPETVARVQRNVRLRAEVDALLVAEARRRGVSIARALEIAIRRLPMIEER